MSGLGLVFAIAVMPLLGQEAPLPPPPLPPPEELPVAPSPAPPVANPREPTYFERCFSYPAIWVRPTVVVSGSHSSTSSGTGPAEQGVHGAAPASGNAQTSEGGGSVGGGGGDGKALLVLAVVLAAALPVVIYVVDSEAPPVALQRYECPSFAFDGMGGGDAFGLPAFAPSALGRFTMAYGPVGADVGLDVVPGGQLTFTTHLLVRPPPKAHLEGGLALGYRYMAMGGRARTGFEVSLPHRYIFWRDGLRTLGLELRPALSFGGAGLDAALEAALVIPIVEFLHLRVGGRAYSFGNSVFWGLNGGVTMGI